MRYIAADASRSQHWLPPFLLYAVLCAVNLAMGGSAPGSALPTFATAAAALLPTAIWLTVAVGNSEDPVQVTITAVAAGSEARLRMAKLLVALTAAVALAVVSMICAGLGTASMKFGSVGDLAAGLAAHLMAAAVGVGIGAWCMRPVLDKRAWAVLTGVGATMFEVLVPGCPPARQTLVLFGETARPHFAATIALIGAESVAIAAALVAGALRCGRSKV